MSWQRVDTKTFTLTVQGGGRTCTAEMFRNSMVNNYRNIQQRNPNKVIGWANPYSPEVNVTDVFQKANISTNGQRAVLIIYGDDPNKIKTYGPYAQKPADYPDKRHADPNVYGSEVYKNWIENWYNGKEYEKQVCDYDKKWYWVVYPADLYIGDKKVSGSGLGALLPILAGAGALLLLSNRKR